MSEIAAPVPDAPTSSTAERPLAVLVAMAAAVALLVAGLVIAGYHALAAPTVPRFATVDLADVVAVREMQALLEATRSGGDAQSSLRAATQWPQDLERTLAAIQEECRCILLVRAAVVASRLTDFTPELKKRMGLDRLDAAELRRALGSELFTSPRAGNALPPAAAPVPAPPSGAPQRQELPYERNPRP
jgi:hypothetical protein